MISAALLRERFEESGVDVLLVDSNAAARSEIEAQLTDFGFRAHAFGNTHFAFSYLLGHLGDIDAVAVSSGDRDGFFDRLDVLQPIASVICSGSDPRRGVEIVLALVPGECGRLGGVGHSFE